MNQPPCVFVVDDDPAALASVTALAESKGVPVQSFTSAEDFLTRFDRKVPGCLVTDYRMTGLNGLELQQRLAAENVPLPVIVITAYADVPIAVESMRAGALTLLQKPYREGELWEAIEAGFKVCAELRRNQARQQEFATRLATLNAGEQAVLRYLMLGHPNKEIAQLLKVGVRTVESRRSAIMTKLEAESLVELVRMVTEAAALSPLLDIAPPMPGKPGHSASCTCGSESTPSPGTPSA